MLSYNTVGRVLLIEQDQEFLVMAFAAIDDEHTRLHMKCSSGKTPPCGTTAR